MAQEWFVIVGDRSEFIKNYPQYQQTLTDDTCYECGKCGELICCDGCPHVFHLNCIGLVSFPDDDYWYCDECVKYFNENTGGDGNGSNENNYNDKDDDVDTGVDEHNDMSQIESALHKEENAYNVEREEFSEPDVDVAVGVNASGNDQHEKKSIAVDGNGDNQEHFQQNVEPTSEQPQQTDDNLQSQQQSSEHLEDKAVSPEQPHIEPQPNDIEQNPLNEPQTMDQEAKEEAATEDVAPCAEPEQ